jgi:putative pyoverdin transport system ATP-binding/permease protein
VTGHNKWPDGRPSKYTNFVSLGGASQCCRIRLPEPLTTFALLIIAGLGAGIGGAGIVHTISGSASNAASLRSLAPQFFFFCRLQLLCKTGLQLLMMSMSQEMVCRLRINLCRKLLLTPHRKLESLGKARLQAILTANITTVTQAAQMLPAVFCNGIVIAVCMGYIAWLSWWIFACFFALFLCVGSAYYMVERWPRRRMRKVREQLNVLLTRPRGRSPRGHFMKKLSEAG